MTPTTTSTCPKCRQPISPGARFCASCGNDISGIHGPGGTNDPALGGTIAVEMDPNVDVLGQMLSEATIGEYDIYGELGRGGMAAVYLGLDIALNRKVAIKTMLPELVSREGMVARFKREAQTAAALSHPHIIQIYSVKEINKLVYFVMKFIEGRSLESVITDRGQVPLEMTQVIVSQVAGALAFAHRKNVVHRDIKPANIMIDEDGWAIVTDFGIAKVQEAQNLTATGTAIGTPHYMSPEQFHNKAVTGASDQYSLGVLTYEMLAGKKPFEGATYAEIITQHLFEPPPDLKTIRADLPDYVIETVNKMMAKDPADRFPDCDAAAHALGTPPTKTGNDAVRTQMISLAKSGPQKKVRMSVPMSPIPVGKKPAAMAATAVESAPRAARPRPKGAPVAEPAASGGAGKWIGIAAVVLALAGGGYYFGVMKPKADAAAAIAAQQVATKATADSVAAAGPSQAEQDSIARLAEQRRIDSLAALAFDRRMAEQRRADSIKTAREARLAAKQAGETKTRTASTTTKGAATETQAAAPVQQQAAPQPEPAPPVMPTGAVKMGSPTPGAVLYINGATEGSLSSLRVITVPAGSVRLTIKAPSCEPWDSIVTVSPGTNLSWSGRRSLKCQ